MMIWYSRTRMRALAAARFFTHRASPAWRENISISGGVSSGALTITKIIESINESEAASGGIKA